VWALVAVSRLSAGRLTLVAEPLRRRATTRAWAWGSCLTKFPNFTLGGCEFSGGFSEFSGDFIGFIAPIKPTIKEEVEEGRCVQYTRIFNSGVSEEYFRLWSCFPWLREVYYAKGRGCANTLRPERDLFVPGAARM